MAIDDKKYYYPTIDYINYLSNYFLKYKFLPMNLFISLSIHSSIFIYLYIYLSVCISIQPFESERYTRRLLKLHIFMRAEGEPQEVAPGEVALDKQQFCS